MFRRACISVALVALSIVSTIAFSGTASASVPPTFCNGKSEESVVVNYRRGSLVLPLRCGTQTYGFRHVVARGRWNADFDSRIAEAIARGQQSKDKTIYSIFNADCLELFRVVVNPGPIGRDGFRPQGVITAYPLNYPNTTSLRSEGKAQASRECPVFVPINEP